METDIKNRFVFTLLLIIVFAFGLGEIPLGIDLKGGAELTYSIVNRGAGEIDQNMMSRTLTVIGKRIDPAGTSNYEVTEGDNQVLISMGGAQTTEIQQVQKLLRKSGRLEMRLELREGGYRSEDFIRAYEARSDGLDNPIEGTHWYKDKSGRNILIEDKVYITGDMLQHSFADSTGDGFTWKVNLKFDSGKGGVEALRRISKIAFENKHSGMAIILNDLWSEETDGSGVVTRQLIKQGVCDSAPSVQSVFTNGACEITGGYTNTEADELVALLDSGSLPIEIRAESAVIVGPSLGAEAVRSGGLSCLVGLGAILLFMLVYYGQLGIVTNICLLINLFLVWVAMAQFKFVLTLPGIAGILLTIGMAVDANILIFERIKEEMRAGHPLARAVETGYEKAFVAIFDSNLTTFLTSVILYALGTGPVKGFAVTLCLGIAASMFSAIYVSRLVVDWMLINGRLKNLSMRRLYSGEFNFTGFLQKTLVVASVVSVLGCLTFLWQKGDDALGLDFRGGTRIQLAFSEPQTMSQVRSEAQAALNSLDSSFKDDLQIIPVKGNNPTTGEPTYEQFILKTKVTDGEGIDVGKTFLKTFENRLRPISLVDNVTLPELKFMRFEFTAAETIVQADLQEELRQSLSDLKLLVVPAELQSNWVVLASPGRVLRDVQNMLAGVLGKRLRPENIRWDAADARKVVIKLFQPKKISDVCEQDLAGSFPEYKGVTGRSVDSPPLLAPEWAQLLELTFTAPIDRLLFADRVIHQIGLVQASPINEGTRIDRLPHIRLRAVADTAAQIEEVLRPAGFVLLSAESPRSGLWLIDAGKADFEGDSDDLEAELTTVLKSMVSNPIVANTTISGRRAHDVTADAIWALFWSLLGILIYIAFRFEFRFGIAAIVALIHDVVISMGVLAILGIEYDLTIVGGLLTVVGYSLNDTIVIFDRVRENLRLWASRPIREVINISVNQTLSRTLLTSMTTLVVVIVLRLWGGDDLIPFSTTMICGIVVGTYSTVFIAAPILIYFGGGLRRSLRPVDAVVEAPAATPDANV